MALLFWILLLLAVTCVNAQAMLKYKQLYSITIGANTVCPRANLLGQAQSETSSEHIVPVGSIVTARLTFSHNGSSPQLFDFCRLMLIVPLLCDEHSKLVEYAIQLSNDSYLLPAGQIGDYLFEPILLPVSDICPDGSLSYHNPEALGFILGVLSSDNSDIFVSGQLEMTLLRANLPDLVAVGTVNGTSYGSACSCAVPLMNETPQLTTNATTNVTDAANVFADIKLDVTIGLTLLLAALLILGLIISINLLIRAIRHRTHYSLMTDDDRLDG